MINYFMKRKKTGLKPNTTREVDLNDERFHKLRKWEITGDFGRIRIKKAG